MIQISKGMAGLSKFVGVLVLLFMVNTLSALPKRGRQSGVDSFDVYWNVPTFQCSRFNVNFEPELKKFGIIVNKDDKFRGEKIVILYDPGLFPAMLEDTSTGTLKERNGGIPQLGNIDDHLKEFEAVVEKTVPKNFAGVGIIDFEAYRPVWRQNWNDQVIYKNMSLALERKRNPHLSEDAIQNKARVNFEAAAKVFMEDTLKQAKTLRPNAKWGYYGFPYCYNSGVDGSVDCPPLVNKENNQIQWLFSGSTAFYPSVYVNSRINANQVKSLVTGRMNEARRMANRVSSSNPPPVYPYVGFRYNSDDGFLSEEKMYNTLDAIRQAKLGGAIIWGSSRFLRSESECRELLGYLQTKLGPALLRARGNSRKAKNIKFRGFFLPESDEVTYEVPDRRPSSDDYQRFMYYLY